MLSRPQNHNRAITITTLTLLLNILHIKIQIQLETNNLFFFTCVQFYAQVSAVPAALCRDMPYCTLDNRIMWFHLKLWQYAPAQVLVALVLVPSSCTFSSSLLYHPTFNKNIKN